MMSPREAEPTQWRRRRVQVSISGGHGQDDVAVEHPRRRGFRGRLPHGRNSGAGAGAGSSGGGGVGVGSGSAGGTNLARMCSGIGTATSGFGLPRQPTDRRSLGEAEDGQAAPVIALVPVRADTGWWHQRVVGHADVLMPRGRLKFGGAGGQSAPFPSAILMWHGAVGHRRKLREAFPDAWTVPAHPA